MRIRRQHPAWKFIADYYCHEVKLIIEVDGEIHSTKENKAYDINRDVTLNEFGIEVIRFSNEQVINEIDYVIDQIKKKIEELKLKQLQEPDKTS